MFLDFTHSNRLRDVFPELSDKQFQIGMYYALGLTRHNISMLTDTRLDAIKRTCKVAKRRWI